MKFIDLFCGIGGFHQALARCGHKCVMACDIDDACIDTYEKNYSIKPFKDITKLDISTIPEFDILCAGFPCQPFSKAGNQQGFMDTRGTLFYNICSIIQTHKPKYVILENVRNLHTHDNGKTWEIIYNSLNDLGYHTYKEVLVLNVLHFNIPQNRERVVILCKRKDIGHLPPRPIIPKQPKKYLTNTLENVMNEKYTSEDTVLSDKMVETKKVWNTFIHICYDKSIVIPKFPIWTNTWDIDVDDTFYNKYKNWIDKNRQFYNENIKDLSHWLIESRENIHWVGAVRKFEWQVKNVNDRKDLNGLLWSCRSSGIRVKDTDYVPTLVAMNHTPVYGPYNRKLSPEELLLLQSFNPIIYDKKRIYKQIGNAVNVQMIYNCVRFLINGVPLFE